MTDPSEALQIDIRLTPFLLRTGPRLAVYAWLGTAGTDRAPNGDFYQISSFRHELHRTSSTILRVAVGGVIIPTNKTEILAPFLAIAGIIAAVSTVELVVRRRKD